MDYFDLFKHMKWYHGTIAGASLAHAGWFIGYACGVTGIDKFRHMIKK